MKIQDPRAPQPVANPSSAFQASRSAAISRASAQAAATSSFVPGQQKAFAAPKSDPTVSGFIVKPERPAKSGLLGGLKKLGQKIDDLVPDEKLARGAKDVFGKLDDLKDKAVDGLKDKALDKILGADWPTTPATAAAEEKRLHGIAQPKVDQLPAEQQKVIEQLRGLGLSEAHLFRGSHVVTNDGGKLYDQWKAQDVKARTSSHYPGDKTQQYEFDMKGLGGMLFGKDAKGNTWFQLENHAASGDAGLAHQMDFLKHKFSGNQNIGPEGYSPHSEKNGKEVRLDVAGRV